MQWLRLFAGIADLVKDGKLPAMARDTVIITVLTIGTGYVSRMDSRFESIELSISKMSDSVVQTSNAIQVNAEKVNWHDKELVRHAREIDRQWQRIGAIEENARRQGIEIPVSTGSPQVSREKTAR